MNAGTVPTQYPTEGRRKLITAGIMLSTMAVALDGTIANVALPQMQSSLSASPEQVVWVLTSYMIASAIMTPLASWLASRFGRKRVMSISVASFTLASLVCGLAGSLEVELAARLVQGISGAGLIPLGQATLLDINPPERQGRAMALAGLGAMLGPLSGPTLGGWLTDALSWRWVFFINLPIGVLAFLALSTFMEESREKGMARFDLLGFATVSILLGGLQLVLDRGPQLDWFDSAEIVGETLVVLLALWLAAVHMATARDTFVRAALFTDRNYVVGCLLSVVVGIITFATVPIVTIMMQNLLGYSALLTGLVSMPRGVGTVMGLIVVGNLIGKIDSRLLLLSGLLLTALGLYIFASLNLDTDQPPMLAGAFLQGIGGGLMIAPLSSLVFSTLKPHFRNEGAAIYALARNIGASLGISLLQFLAAHNDASVAGRLAEGIRPDNPELGLSAPALTFDDLPMLRMMAGQISRQAAMVATIDTLWLTFLVTCAALPLALAMRTKHLARSNSPAPHPVEAAAH